MIICLTGMHRSGTSLMASYLMACGIPMGDDLKVASVGNDHGHFEDVEYLQFHKQIIRSNNTNMYCPRKALEMNERERQQAKHMIERRCEKYDIWGWKEPRTVLFLDDWNSLGKDIKYVFMYRHPLQVVRSLYKRKDRWLYARPWLAPLAWLYHNEALLSFYEQHKDRSVIVGINGFKNRPDESRELLSKWLNVELSEPYSVVYKPKSISSEREGTLPFPFSLYWKFILQHYGNRLDSTYARLNKLALINDL